jgi:hypothetical protein
VFAVIVTQLVTQPVLGVLSPVGLLAFNRQGRMTEPDVDVRLWLTGECDIQGTAENDMYIGLLHLYFSKWDSK